MSGLSPSGALIIASPQSGAGRGFACHERRREAGRRGTRRHRHQCMTAGEAVRHPSHEDRGGRTGFLMSARPGIGIGSSVRPRRRPSRQGNGILQPRRDGDFETCGSECSRTASPPERWGRR
jgi:hypothetical protein